jgi:hypothetical protein
LLEEGQNARAESSTSSLILRPVARVWIASDRGSRPLASSTARLESITVAGARVNALGSSKLYVAHTALARAGKYWLLVEPVGGRRFAALAPFLVKKRTTALPVAARAPFSQTPTIASARGDLHAITTQVPPDRELLRYSAAASLAARRPFVVVFASPAICLNRTCGPIVDIVNEVRGRFPDSGIRFIHVEPFLQNNPALGFNRWAKEWSIPSEPFTFLVGKDGRIKAEFEGSASAIELATAVLTTLLNK